MGLHDAAMRTPSRVTSKFDFECRPIHRAGYPSLSHHDIIERLSKPPYHLITRPFQGGFDRAQAMAFLSGLAREQRMSFTRVRIDPVSATRESRGTRYSRTNLPLSFHTDTAHANRPHSLVAFAMIYPDPSGGGLSSVAPVKHIVEMLSVETQQTLRRPCFDFGRGNKSILWGPADDPSMRYYRKQLDECAQRKGISPNHLNALKELDDALADYASSRWFALRKGDWLFLNNHKALHARTGFPTDSKRLMLRYRVRIDELG